MNALSGDTTSANAVPPRRPDIRSFFRPLWVGLALAASLHADAGRPDPAPIKRSAQPPRVVGEADASEKTAKSSVAEATAESVALPVFPADRRDTGAKATVVTAATASPDASKQAPAAERRLFSFQAVDLDLKAALALFAKANNLNIVPDREVTGLVTVDLHELPLQQVMRAMLEAYDYWWVEEDGLIRVRATQTRQFSINYLRLVRKGTGQTSATLSSGSGASGGGGSGGGGGGGGSSGGGGGGASGGGGGGASGGGGGASGGGSTSSSVSLTADNPVDFWTELKTELGKVLTDAGRTSMAVNMTAGMLMITDRPGALKRAEMYLKNLERTVVRQVEIEARLYSVTLNDQFQFGVDWNQAIKMYGNTMSIGSLPAALNQPIAGTSLPSTAIPGPGGSTIGNLPNSIKGTGGAGVNDSAVNLSFNNANTAVLVRALQEQGSVKVISKPRVRTLNNQTALIKVGTEKPYFRRASTTVNNGSAGSISTQGDEVTFVTIGTILSLTPQVSEEGWITLDVSPVLSSLIGDVRSPSGETVAPQLDIKQVSTIVRVRDGSTVVIGGLIQNEEGKVNRKIPFFGDIPLLGRLFQGQFDSKNRNELVIFITPRVVSGEGETESAGGR